jgi:hypothetical protein
MLLFQTQIEEHQKLAEHYRELAAKREAKAAELVAIERQVMGAIQTLNEIKQNLDADAIATLQSAVMGLFATAGNDGGNQPTLATPDTDPTGLTGLTGLVAEADDDDDFELLCLNGETGDCLTTDDLEDTKPQRLTYTQAIKNRCSACWGYEVKSKDDIKAGFINRTDLSFMEAVNLERKGKEFYQTVETYLDRFYYNGQSCEWASPLASPLCSLVWEDAPLLGQHCQWASPFASPLACAVEFSKPETQKPAFTEFVEVSDRVGYLKIQHSGEIKAVYAGFSQKQRAESWGKWLAVRHSIASGFEVRAAKHLPFKWELKLWGLNMNQINRLASENLAASPHTEVDSAKPPSYKKPEHPQPVSAEAVKPGDIVAPLLSPENTYEVIQVMPNGILDCKSLKTGVNMGMRPAAVTLVSKSEQEAGIIQVGNLIEVKDPTDGEPKTGVVQEISRNPLAPIVVLFKDGSVEEFYRSQIKLLRDISVPAIAFNDLVEVPGQVGVFGRVKIIKDSRIGVEVDEQLEYFETKELKVKVRAADEAASSAPQSQGLKSGQVLMGNRIVTTGNSTGLARRSSTLNTPMGTADKVAALELVNAGLSPELAMVAATGTTEEDYDF